MFETHMTVVGKLVTGRRPAPVRRRLGRGELPRRQHGAALRPGRRRPGRTATSCSSTCACWRRLAENAFASLVKGDAVVVTGRLYTREFEHEGRRRSTMTLEAQSVAADLSWCTAVLTRTDRRDPTAGRPRTAR